MYEVQGWIKPWEQGTSWKTELQGLEQTESGQLNWLLKSSKRGSLGGGLGVLGKWSVTALALDTTIWFREGGTLPDSDREDEGEK